MAEKPAATGADQQQGEFGIQKVYIKDLSFETPHSPGIFTEEWKPSVNLQMSSHAQKISETGHEVVLTVTVTVKFEDKTVYLVEVQQAGIFHISKFPEEIVKQMLGIMCPNILFPFARELISDLATRGGFPQLLLSPVNFEALYAQHQQQQASQEAPEPKSTH